MKESIKDRITNSILFVKALARSVKSDQTPGNQEPSTNQMKLKFTDDFNTFNTDVWRIGQPWGVFHPGSLYQYYGEDSVYVKDGQLILTQTYSPKEFTLADGSKVTIPYSVGLVSSNLPFGYGFYEFEVSLPIGKGLWPAVWFNGIDNWPPEIDVVEAYSDESGKYSNRLQTNCFFGPSTGSKMLGPRNNPVHDPLARLKMSCWWTKDFIKLYYNGYLVRVVTSKEVLKWFTDQRMSIVLNNAIRQEYSDSIKEQTSYFIIHGLKAWS
jgi:beta-glucanase (GH16 family)